jgi:hypothetical protein
MMDACFMDSQHIMGNALKLNNNQRMQGLRIFVNMFITKHNQMISFIYNHHTGKLDSKKNVTNINQTNGCHKNFPIGTFFDEKRFKIHIVYRQGDTFQIDLNNPDKKPFQ